MSQLQKELCTPTWACYPALCDVTVTDKYDADSSEIERRSLTGHLLPITCEFSTLRDLQWEENLRRQPRMMSELRRNE